MTKTGNVTEVRDFKHLSSLIFMTIIITFTVVVANVCFFVVDNDNDAICCCHCCYDK